MTTCPQCHTRYSQSGEPNCWCEPKPVRAVILSEHAPHGPTGAASDPMGQDPADRRPIRKEAM